MKSPPKSFAPHWWRRALEDGRHCENKRRERFFSEYYAAAESELKAAGLIPDELLGPFWLLYRRGFRSGYDYAVSERARDKAFLSRRRKYRKLGSSR